MKKKLLTNAIAAVVTLSLLAATSFALFTSTSAVNSNSLVNGTVSLTVVDPDNNAQLAFGADPAKKAVVYSGRTPNNAYNLQKDMLPNNEVNFAAGDTTSRIYVLKNTGSLDMFYRWYLSNVKLTLRDGTKYTDVSDPIFSNYTVNVFATNTHCGGFNNPTGKLPNSRGSAGVTKFSQILSSSNAVSGILYAVNGSVATGSSSAYKLKITLNDDANQSLQGATITFDVNYDAVQVANNTLDPKNLRYQGFGGSPIDLYLDEQSKISWN